MASSDMDERTVTISGVPVTFPCKPYPSQFGMMDKVIKGLVRKQNSLLESPTGSGKSLALLCSALAWQQAEHVRQTKEDMAAQSGDGYKACQCGSKTAQDQQQEYSPESKPKPSKGDEDDAIELSDDDDFKTSNKKSARTNQGEKKKRRHVSISYEDEAGDDCEETKCSCGAASNDAKRTKVPKIYFGTRTHKQIAQITRELRKTAYHNVRMTILASREHTCVHPEVSRSKNKSEGCRERLDIHGPGCSFNDKAKRVYLAQQQLQDDLTTAWDLEDLIGKCRKKKACPYFVTRNVLDGADIVFCPYNYLIEPLIRKSMDIVIKDQIVILDEAHNIEDSARDAASDSITTDQITQAIHNITELMDHGVKFADHVELRNMLERLQELITSNSTHFEHEDYDSSYTTWSGYEMIARLNNIGLGPENLSKYQKCYTEATANEEEVTMRNQRNQVVKMNSSTSQLIECLLQMLDYMYRHDLKFMHDYRLCIMKSMQWVANRDTANTWLNKSRRGGSKMVVFTLHFWCMNPAVAFSDFSVCRSIVLSSGTLSPMSTFASELGTPFPIQLEANHVIEDKQVFVGAIGSGPNGHQLQAVYRNMEKFDFQEELGKLILQVCISVPHGVLCFLPSYRALENFTRRWKEVGLWSKMACRKRIMVEPRAADREDFDALMKAFYQTIKGDYTAYYNEDDYDDMCGDEEEIDGALFFAVCRGKVSEGMDFTDNNARAVITVGIPFPNYKNTQVKLKREYNDKYKVERGLLSGNEWYEIQAYRALNQALGRCLRHRKDWGALIMVDDRFVKNTGKYCKSLSRWVRSKVRTYEMFSEFKASLQAFTQKMVKEMPVINLDESFIPRTPIAVGHDSRTPIATGHDSRTPTAVGHDSVYKRHSLDSSYDYKRQSPNTSHDLSPSQQSPYFGSPPLAGPSQLLQTPTTSSSKKQLKSKGHNSILPLTASKGSNSVQTPIAPTDKTVPATVGQQQTKMVLVQGPNNQQFLVPANIKSGTSLLQSSNLAPGLQMATGQQQAPAGQQSVSGLQLVTGLDGKQMTIMSPSVKGTVSSTNQNTPVNPAQTKGNDSATKGSNTVAETESKPESTMVSADGKPATIFQLGKSCLKPEVQLKIFLKMKEAPKDRDYYVLVNQGLSTEMTFFVEPDKKGKQNEPEKQATMKKEVVEPDSSTADVPVANVQCLPTLTGPHDTSTRRSASVPVAAVAPQQVADVKPDPSLLDVKQPLPACTSPVLFEENSGIADTDNTSNVTPHTATGAGKKKARKPIFRKTATMSSTGKNNMEQASEEQDNGTTAEVNGQTSNVEKYAEANVEVKIEAVVEMNTDTNANAATVEDMEDFQHTSKVNSAKKSNKSPATEKSSNSTEKLSKSTDKSTEGLSKSEAKNYRLRRLSNNTSGDKSEKDNEMHEKGDAAMGTGACVTDEPKLKSRTCSKSCNMAIDDVLDDGAIDAAALHDGRATHASDTMALQVVQGADAGSEEDFLNVRRRGGRKRKSTSKYADYATSKRSKKGVDFDNDEDEQNISKENMVQGKHLCCASCGVKWSKQSGYERRKRHPEFAAGVFKKNTELLYLPMFKLQGSQLLPITGISGVKGLVMNGVYEATHGCCVQYLQCKACNDGPVIGVTVVLADTTSQYKASQTWLLSSATKT